MLTVRIIPKLEVKGQNLIKGVRMEGLRIMGKPEDAALRYYHDGADELIYIDLVASLYQREAILSLVRRTAQQVFIPLTVGGGIRTIDDIRTMLRAGADKVAINTAAVKRPNFIREAAQIFGSQCIVISIEAQRKDGGWEPYTDSGRTSTGLDAVDWAKHVASLGAGEILLTSINQDGTYEGYDLELIRSIATYVPLPVIAGGGAGSPNDFYKACTEGKADALCASAAFHFRKTTIRKVKSLLRKKGVPVREKRNYR